MKNNYNLWYYIKFYKFKSVFAHTFLIVLLLMLMTILGMGFAISSYNNSVLENEVSGYNMDELVKSADSTDALMQRLDELALLISKDSDVLEFMALEERGDYVEFVELVHSIQTKYASYDFSSQYGMSAYVYSQPLNYVIGSTNRNGPVADVFSENWVTDYEQKLNKNFWIEITSRDERKYLSLFRTLPLYMLDADKKRGVIQIDVDLANVTSLVNTPGKVKEADFFIINDDQVFYHSDFDLILKNVSEIDQLTGLVYENGETLIRSVDGKRTVVSFRDSKYNGFRYMIITSFSDYKWISTKFRTFVVSLIVLFIFIAIVASAYVSMRVFRPIGNLMSLVDDPEGMLPGEVHEDDSFRGEEFRRIFRYITNFWGENKRIKGELEDRLQKLKKTQTTALQSQITPHFLYNTLENIKWEAVGLTGGENNASRMITILSRLFKVTFEVKDVCVSISKEIEYAKMYIEIQKLRYEEKFDVTWNVDEEVLNYLVPKLVIQPIVENAIYYGIKPKRTNGHITITGRLEKEYIVLEIADDGVGISYERLREVREGMAQSETATNAHIGLQNVNQRIKLIYGNDYGLQIEHNRPSGVKVTITVPTQA